MRVPVLICRSDKVPSHPQAFNPGTLASPRLHRQRPAATRGKGSYNSNGSSNSNSSENSNDNNTSSNNSNTRKTSYRNKSMIMRTSPAR